MIRSVNYGFYSGQMSVTQRQGVIVCIPKEGKDKQFWKKNWRLITLMNTMYKIASSSIAARLKTVLPKLIGDDQVFLKGRYIGGNIRLLYDTLLYAKQHQIPSDLLLMVDFEKAFDSVAWSSTDFFLCA